MIYPPIFQNFYNLNRKEMVSGHLNVNILCLNDFENIILSLIIVTVLNCDCPISHRFRPNIPVSHIESALAFPSADDCMAFLSKANVIFGDSGVVNCKESMAPLANF